MILMNKFQGVKGELGDPGITGPHGYYGRPGQRGPKGEEGDAGLGKHQLIFLFTHVKIFIIYKLTFNDHTVFFSNRWNRRSERRSWYSRSIWIRRFPRCVCNYGHFIGTILTNLIIMLNSNFILQV